MFWAFPRDERDIRMYSSPSGSIANALEYQNSPYCQGMRLLEQGPSVMFSKLVSISVTGYQFNDIN